MCGNWTQILAAALSRWESATSARRAQSRLWSQWSRRNNGMAAEKRQIHQHPRLRSMIWEKDHLIYMYGICTQFLQQQKLPWCLLALCLTISGWCSDLVCTLESPSTCTTPHNFVHNRSIHLDIVPDRYLYRSQLRRNCFIGKLSRLNGPWVVQGSEEMASLHAQIVQQRQLQTPTFVKP